MADWRERMEPRLLELLDRKLARQGKGRYLPLQAGEVAAMLGKLLEAHGEPRPAQNVRRMGGGASKEQFVFELAGRQGGPDERFVLRMDPLEGIIETCRRREAQVLVAVRGLAPVPDVAFVDGDGAIMGQPAMITRFVGGVTKPTTADSGPSGLGTVLGERISNALTPQYIGNLVAIHTADLTKVALPDFSVPTPGTTEAAEWQVNYWARVMVDDKIDASPLLAFTETWLRDHLPVCETPLLLHGDYRLGNFMFDEASLQMTAILDWELSHIGDYHEDLAYSLDPLFCSRDAAGRRMVASMMSVEQFLDGYAAATGRIVDPAKLHWYRVLTSFKLVVMNFASGARAARDGTNHQSALLGWLAAVQAGLSTTLCDLLEGGAA